MSNSLIIPTPSDNRPTLGWVEDELPRALLRTLERRWLEDLVAGRSRFKHTGGDPNESRFFRIHQVRHSPDRQLSLHPSNMLNVLSSLRDSNHSLLYGLRSGPGGRLALRMGLRRFRSGLALGDTAEYTDLLRQALRSNFPGIELSDRLETFGEVEEDWLMPFALPKPGERRACLTGIPSLKADAAAFFTQSVDRLVDALRGETYALLILAEPIDDLTAIQDRARALSEEVHALVRRTLSESRNQAQTRGETTGQSTTLSGGVGGVLGALVGFQLARGYSSAKTLQDTDSAGLSLSYERLDKTAQYCEAVLDAFQARLQRGRNLGFWNVGVFLSATNDQTFLRAQGILRGLYTGQGSYAEPLRLIDLTEAPVGDALERLRLPRLDYDQEHPLSVQFHGLGTPLATDELAVMMSLPHREVPGLKLRPTVDFNLNPPPADGFRLGTLLYRGEDLGTPVRVPARELTRHAFVTGLTGAGKTNTCLALLREAYRNQRLPFMVIDPAKTEYRFLQDDPTLRDDLLIFTLGDEKLGPFRLNPFEFEPGFSLLGHVDLVKAVFNAAFPMYASMPYILEEAILAVYTDRGWNLAESTNTFMKDKAADPGLYWPRLRDLHAKVDEIVASKRYGAQLSQDISAALRARLGSLLQGNKGRMLDTARSTPFDQLLSRPVVLELRDVADGDEKAFIMALVFIRLYEACRARGIGNRLRHMTLIEEAHRLLRHVPAPTSAESANPRGKTVEMFADMMAEMRVYGEGFIVVDQTPAKLIPDAIKGSNLKIIHRLLALEDRAAVGAAMNLSPDQMEELTRLRQGRAVVHSEGLEEACLVRIDPIIDQLAGIPPNDPEAREAWLAERERNYEARIQDSMARFYADYPDVYWDLSLEPSAAVLVAANRFTSALLVGQGKALVAAWRAVDEALVHHTLGVWDGDRPRRARALLAARAAGGLARRHPAADWGVRLVFQERLIDLWQLRPNAWNGAATEDARAALLAARTAARRLAARPRHLRPGCVACKARCHFGHRLQPVNSRAAARLVTRLQDTAGPTPQWQALRRQAAQQFPLELTDEARNVAAYCLLTQISDDERVLAEAHRRCWGQAAGETKDE